MIFALIKSLRPKQWTKNLLVFAGYLFTLDQTRPPGTLITVLSAFGLMCAVSGVVYIFNDALDAEKDRNHPLKSKRPIASGAVSVRAAVTFAIILLLVSVFLSFYLDPFFGVLVLAYLALTSAYSARLKHIVIIDLLAIAVGFVIRAVAGAVVITVINPETGAASRAQISPWLILCTTLLALFLGLAKRRAELMSLENGGTNHRKILGEYSAPMLDQMLNISASVALMAYFLYTFTWGSRTGTSHPYIMATIPFVICGIFRYLFLIHTTNAGATPEQLLLEDKPMLINLILWAVAAVIAMRV